LKSLTIEQYTDNDNDN